MKRATIIAASVIPPCLLGLLTFLLMVKDIMIHQKPEPLADEALKNFLVAPQNISKQPLALILLANDGTQISEILLSAQALNTKKFNVLTAAPKKVLSTTTGSVSIFPHFTFDEAPQADLLVIPSVLDSTKKEVIAFATKQARQAKLVLIQGEGLRLLAGTGLLSGRTVTVPALVHEDMRNENPSLNFADDLPYLRDGKFITTKGLSLSAEAAEFAAESYIRSFGESYGNSAARESLPGGLPQGVSDTFQSLGFGDFAQLVITGAFSWNRKGIGVLISDDVNETRLAAVLDTYPRTMAARTLTVALKRRVITSESGLLLVPTIGLDQFPPHIDLVYSIGTNGEAAALEKNMKARGISLETLGENIGYPQAQVETYSKVLGHVANLTHERSAVVAAKLLGVSEFVRTASHRLQFNLLLRPLLLGLFGGSMAWLYYRRKESHRNARPTASAV